MHQSEIEFEKLDPIQLAIKAGKVFTPASPINSKEFFSGRINQVRKVVDAVGQESRHVVIFGERGVGKTSFSNVLSSFVAFRGSKVLPIKVNCDSGDNFSSIWRKVFTRITITSQEPSIGFNPEVKQSISNLNDSIPKDLEITPDIVMRFLTPLGNNIVLIIIIDEFDRMQSIEDKRLFADTIKTLSDYNSPFTLILVGVSDSINGLILEHQSVERALVQVQMPRMEKSEISEIIHKGAKELGLQINSDAEELICTLSRGLPHYTHLLSLHAARRAIDDSTNQIDLPCVEMAIETALEDCQQSISNKYSEATYSPRNTIFPQVLLACAIAKTDEFGYFTASSVCEPLNKIMRKKYDVTGFVRNLNDFCSDNKGNILEQKGEPRKRSYRFKNPLMQPYVIMKGISEKLIDKSLLRLVEI